MDVSKLPAITFNGIYEAVAATCPVSGELEFESARRAVVASEYLCEHDSKLAHLVALLSVDGLAELVANIRQVIHLIDGCVLYQPEEESGSEIEPELWDEDEILVSYRAQLQRFSAQLEEASA